MTLLAQITEETYGALNPLLQAEYVKGEDDNYYPDIKESGGWSFEHTQALKATMKTERDRRVEWETKHKALEKKWEGVDASELKGIPGLRKQIDDLKASQTDDSTTQATKIAALEADYQMKLSALEVERDSGFGDRDRRITSMTVATHSAPNWSKLKCIDSSLHKTELDAHTSVVDGVVVVIDDSGEPLQTAKKGAVGNMSLEEYQEGFKTKYPQNFEGSRATGGGGDPTAAGGGGAVSNDKHIENPVERLKAYHQRNI